MKFTIKKAIAAIAAAVTIVAMPMSASAATNEDVVQAARNAGFLEEYVQTLANFLNVTEFTPEQLDKAVATIATAGSEFDKYALMYFNVTVNEMKGLDENGNPLKPKDNEEPKTNNDPEVRNKLVELYKKMPNESVIKIINNMKKVAKDLGMDLSYEKKGEKEYVITVKDDEGNVVLVTPVGKLVDTTGADDSGEISIALILAVFGGSAALGCAGAYVLASISKKKED